MKVLSLAEFVNMFDTPQHQYLLAISDLFPEDMRYSSYPPLNPIGKVRLYSEWLSQPFKPKMIVKLFRNFEQKTNHKSFKFYDEKTTGYSLRLKLYDNKIEIYDTELTLIHFSVMPNNLHDFESDCYRAGITLEWNV